MASNRINRINEEIQKELSSLFRTLKDPRVQGGMVTVTHVDTTSDLRYAKVFVSVLDKSQEKDVLRGLPLKTFAKALFNYNFTESISLPSEVLSIITLPSTII